MDCSAYLSADALISRRPTYLRTSVEDQPNQRTWRGVLLHPRSFSEYASALPAKGKGREDTSFQQLRQVDDAMSEYVSC